MTIAKDFAAKLSVAFVAAAMIVSAYAPAAQAQTTEELQEMINQLLEQVAALQASTGQGGTSVASGVCPYTWTRDLSSGSKGADVMKLQQFLNASADTRVAASGAGSVGAETEFYGPATAAAVSKMQVTYRADILSPANLVNPTGYFGPSSRAKANSLCTTAPVVDTEDGDTTDEEEDDNGSMTLQGEGILDSYDIQDADDTDIQEGANDEVIAELTFEATDGDLELNRIYMTIAGVNTPTDNDPWDVFETFSLWVDGDMIAEFDASDEDEYTDTTSTSAEFRFSNLGLVLPEDEEVEVLVAATINNNIDDAGIDASWEISVDEVRTFDADGVADNDSSTGDMNGSSVADAVGFDIVVEGDGEELRFSTASNNPDATDIIVDLDSKTNGVTILEYDIEARDNDIELNTLFVKVTTSAASSSMVIDDIALEIDGQTFDAENSPSTVGNVTTFEFDIDGDITIDDGDEVTVAVVVDLRSQESSNNVDRYSNGTTIEADVTTVERDLTDAEGSDDITDLSGTADGESHTLVAEGIVVPVDEVVVSADASGDQDQFGEFSIEFDVTAIEGTFYINDLATTTAGNATALLGGVQFAIEGGTATAVSATLSSTGDEATDGAFEISDGETETFTLDVTFTAVAGAQFRVVLQEVWYSADDDGENADPYLTVPASDFRTGYKQVNLAI